MQVVGKKPIGTVAYMGGVLSVPEPFCFSLAQMVQYNSEYLCDAGEYVHYDRATVSYHAFARNTLCDRFQGDWLLMLDTDHVFDPDICARMVYLMNKHNVEVLTGIYQYKSEPHSPVLYQKSKDGNAFEMIGKWDDNCELFEIASSGGGCLLIKKSVIKRIKEELREGAFDITPPFSEDHSFFKRLEKLNIKAYCAPGIESSHLKYKEITMQDYKIEDLKFGERIEVGGLK